MSERMDDLAGTVATRTTRRGALLGLSALALGGAGSLVRGQGAAARPDHDPTDAQADAGAARPDGGAIVDGVQVDGDAGPVGVHAEGGAAILGHCGPRAHDRHQPAPDPALHAIPPRPA